MNSVIRLVVFLWTIAWWQFQLSAQTVPRLLPFQGRLTDQNGVAVPDGVRLIQFNIFDIPSGGSPVWAGELHRTTVNGGLVNILLGSKTPFTGFDFDRQLYLELTVDVSGPNGLPDNAITPADPPMLPRQAILPVVFAKEAANSRKLNGYDWTPIFGTNDPTLSIPVSKLADNSLPASKIVTNSIGSRQIAMGSIGADRIVPRSITTNELAEAVLDLLIPPGTVVAFAGSNIPRGWLLCDGTALLRADSKYQRLFTAISTNWGFNSSEDFCLPDLQGVFLRGVNNNRGDMFLDPDRHSRIARLPNGITGNSVGSYQSDDIKSHRHSLRGVETNPGPNQPLGIITDNGYGLQLQRYEPIDLSGALDPAGGLESRPKNAYVNYMIKY
ncbi:MAG TPA: phage tail protein [Verrucomicrobiota bacterium]|nr:hypothetical protein [Verrucomicrobiales bacterium]HRI11532.1 phage tail protein [Verrucomicrobiota bacterium]